MPDKLRIILVEDLETDAELVIRELKRGGINATAIRVETEIGLLAQLETFKPDVILTDYSMPQFDGLTALAITRKHSPDVPFIFVSGTLGEENAIRALKAGATDYVLKNNLLRLAPAVHRATRDARENATAKRREIEAGRREAEDRKLRSLIAGIVDLMSTPFVVTDTNAIIQIINPAFTKAFGWSFGELAGKDVRELVPDENAGIFREAVRADAQARVLEYETYLRNKSGSLVGVRFSTRSIDVDGEPKAHIAFIDHIESNPPDPSEIRPPISKGKFEQGMAALAERAARLKGIVAGRINLQGLRAVEAKLKGEWPAKKRRIMDTALAIIGRNLGPRDLISEEDEEFLLAFHDMTEQEAELTCRAVETRVSEFLFGEFGIGPGDLASGDAPPVRITTISSADIAKFGSVGLVLQEKLGAPQPLAMASALPNLEADIQRRRERLVSEFTDLIAKAKIGRREVVGPKGPAPDVDCLDYDLPTIQFFHDNFGAYEAIEGLKVEVHLARFEAALTSVIGGAAGSGRKRHLAMLTIDVLRDQAARRRFLTLWRLVPTDLQKRVILCFHDVDRGLAPVAVESAILQVAGLVFATGVVLINPIVPNFNFQLIKGRVAIIDMFPGFGVGPFSDHQWSGVVRTLHQKGCKVFVRAGEPGRELAPRIGADGAIT